MSFSLSVNGNPFVNRYAEPEDLVRALASEIGIGRIQLTHEFINPSWGGSIVAGLTRRLAKAAGATGLAVTSLMTGPSGRLNHFGHPEPELRCHYLEWFKLLVDIAADLGAIAAGSQFAILTYRDWDELDRRRARLAEALACWSELAEHAARRGLAFLFWEPMSVGRELGHTIADCVALQAWIDSAKLALPLRPLIDIDHGDLSSPDQSDTDPYAWARTFAAQSPIIHIKQSSMNKSGHWPFTAAYNAIGRIQQKSLLDAVQEGGGRDNELCLELGFREREPDDRAVVAALRESVAFWAPFADAGLPGRAPLSAAAAGS